MRNPRQKGKPLHCKQLPEKECLFQKIRENRVMVLILRKEQDMREGRCRSPDPFMFNDTIFLEHDAEASEARDDPIGQLRSRLALRIF